MIGGGNTAVGGSVVLFEYEACYGGAHRDKFRAEKILKDHLLEKSQHGNVNIVWIMWSRKSWVRVKCDWCASKNARISKKTQELAVSGMFIAIGLRPEHGNFCGSDMTKNGYIFVKSGLRGNATATNIPGVFAAGDVADPIYRQRSLPPAPDGRP